MQRLAAIEMFAGTGGLAIGMSRAGFEPALLIDFNSPATATLRANAGRVATLPWTVVHDDVVNVDFSPHAGIDLLAAGAPCQPFSLGGRHRAHQDARDMFPEVARAVRETRPKAVLVENVKGLVRPAFKPYFDYILRRLERPECVAATGESWESHDLRLAEAIASGEQDDLAYDVSWQSVNAADFGVPQRRERVFITAFRRDLGIAWSPPDKTHSRDALFYAQYVDESYWMGHGLRSDGAPRDLQSVMRRLRDQDKPAKQRWATVRDALVGLPVPRESAPSLLFTNHIGRAGAQSYTGHTGSPLDRPSKTLKAGVHGVPGGENMLRYPDGSVRYFTAREAARLQTFPDEYEFVGPWTEVMRQLGNAVPVLVAERFAARIAEHLKMAGVTRALPAS